MIVCICNNVSDRQIKQAVQGGATSLAALRNELDVGTCCGKCHSCAKRIVRECQQDESRSHAISFMPGALAGA